MLVELQYDPNVPSISKRCLYEMLYFQWPQGLNSVRDHQLDLHNEQMDH